MHTSWSEIDTARQCLMKHHLHYKERYREKGESPALVTGNRWHSLMQELYTTGEAMAPVDMLKEWRKEGQSNELIDQLTWMLHGYYQQWGTGDPLWQKKAVLIEERFEVELPDIGFGELTLVFVLDLLVELMGRLWLVDHKSGKYAANGRDLEMADQWTLYVWALRQKGIEVFGSVHNYARTDKLVRDMTLKERFARTPIHRTPLEVESVARESTVLAWLAKGENGAPRSPSDACFRRCGFFDVCVSDRRYGERIASDILQIRHYKKDKDNGQDDS